jgi:hypothetical protein
MAIHLFSLCLAFLLLANVEMANADGNAGANACLKDFERGMCKMNLATSEIPYLFCGP